MFFSKCFVGLGLAWFSLVTGAALCGFYYGFDGMGDGIASRVFWLVGVTGLAGCLLLSGFGGW